MSNKKLKQAPLKEVVFELKWDLPVDEKGVYYDPGFSKAFGLFAKTIEPNFPVQKPVYPFNSIPDAYVLSDQFWRHELVWPVIGIGKGVLSVNDTEGNYVWEETYRPNIDLAINALVKSYDRPLLVKSLSLRYIDAVDVANTETDSLNYISNNFLIDIKNHFDPPGQHIGISITQGYDLGNQSRLQIQLQTATNNKTNKNALVWNTLIERLTPIDINEVLLWLDQAHDVCSQMFVNILNPDFYASFDR